ncbi:hypothetical protein PFISCL1PPCAC_21794, partial [Pristionchus fissidentatus]
EEKEDDEETEKEDERENGPVAKKRMTQKKEGKRDMECPKCTNYRSTSLRGLIGHLKRIHGMSPTEAGIKFVCDCGHKSASAEHSEFSQVTFSCINLYFKQSLF